MLITNTQRLLTLVVGAGLLFFGIGTGFSQEKKPEKNSSEQKSQQLHEQTVYVPYEKLRSSFEKDGRGVFLPYEEFQQLWKAARAAEKEPESKPSLSPVPYMITETVNQARIVGEIVQVESFVRINILQDGWKEIPLRLNNVALTKATIRKNVIDGHTNSENNTSDTSKHVNEADTVDGCATNNKAFDSDTFSHYAASDGEPARIRGNQKAGYFLLVEGKKDETLELLLNYARSIDKSPGRNSVSFEVSPAPINRWKVCVPESDVKIDFSPMIAATELSKLPKQQEQPKRPELKSEEQESTEQEATVEKPSETVLLAFAGGMSNVQIGWTPKSEGATGLDALTSVQLEEKVQIEEGIVRTEARLHYTISRSQIERLAIAISKDQKVVEVFDANIRQWTLKTEDDSQIIEVELFEPAKAQQQIIIKLERFIENESDSRRTSISIPGIRAVDVGRQQGILVVRSSEGLSVDVQKSLGLLQMDASELPQNIQQQKWDYAYRISTSNYELTLSAEKILPRISAKTQSGLRINPPQGNLSYITETIYHIERAGVFQLFCDIPDGFEISGVASSVRGERQIPLIESYHLSEDVNTEGMRRLTVNLSRKAIGHVKLSFFLIKRFNEPDFLSLPGKTVDFKIQLPTVPLDFVHRREGILLIEPNSGLRMTPTNLRGVQSLPVDQVRTRWTDASSTAQQVILPSAALGLVYGQEPSSFDLKVERRQPRITAQQMLRVRIDNGVVKYTDRFNYDIQFSGVKRLRIDVPESIADKIRNTNSHQLRETKMVPQPDDLAGDLKEGLVAFSFEHGGEILGSVVFELSWEEELKQLEVGKKVPITVPQLIPRNVDRSFGHIVISKAASIDLKEESSSGGLRPVDPQHEIPVNDRTTDTAAAFEFFDQWSLELSAVRYQNEELKKTSLEEGLLQIVSVRSSENLTARALYRVRSVKQRLGLALPQDAVVNDVRINGRVVALESNGQSKDKEYLIPLNSVVPDTPFLLELRYSYPGSIRQIEIPRFPGESLYEQEPGTKETPPMGAPSSERVSDEGPAIQNMRIAVYVPENDVLASYQGPWTPHFRFSYDTPTTWVSNGSQQPESLMQEIGKGISGEPSPSSFPVAGSVYVFSALQPGTTPQDMLQLYSAKERNVKLFFFSLFLLVGLVLCPFNWSRRFTFLILFIIVCCILGIFLPTLTAYLSEHAVFGQAVFWVVLLWCVVSLFRFAKAARTNFLVQRADKITEQEKAKQKNQSDTQNDNEKDQPVFTEKNVENKVDSNPEPNASHQEGGNES